jgi:hypothetical protein
VITRHEIISTIDEALTYFSSLSPKDVETLNTNLGLSNLGLNPTEKRFSEYLDSLVLELLAVREDYQIRPVETHWDLIFVLKPIRHAIEAMKKIIVKLTSDAHEIVFLDTHAELQKAIVPFERIQGIRFFDPLEVSRQVGKDWTTDIHGEIEEDSDTFFNTLIMINQYLHLLQVIRDRYEFIASLLEGDFAEISKVIEWQNQFEPFQELDTEVSKQLELLERIYFGIDPDLEDVEFEVVLTYFQDMFQAEQFQYRFASFLKDCEWTFVYRDDQGNEVVGDYLDLSIGLSEVRKLHRNYEVWREEFWTLHKAK